MKRKILISALCGIVLLMLVLYTRAPLWGGDINKQSIYLWVLDSWYGQDNNTTARLMLVDDDSEEGIFKIKKICDELKIKAAFAVIPSRINNALGDSLRQWQKEGFGICQHGYNHDKWKNWTYDAIIEDIRKSNKALLEMGFCIEKIKYIVPAHSCNTRNIRQAIENEGYQMICGASIINPDTELFQLGRIFINKDTNLKKMLFLLEKAKERKMFVILGTHSSNSKNFSEEKTKQVLMMAKNLNYDFYY